MPAPALLPRVIGSGRRTNGGPRADGEHAREIGGDVGQFKSPLNQPTAEQDIEIAKQEDEREQKELESGETVGVCFTVEEENTRAKGACRRQCADPMPLATRRWTMTHSSAKKAMATTTTPPGDIRARISFCFVEDVT